MLGRLVSIKLSRCRFEPSSHFLQRMDIISCKDAYESLSSSIFKQNLIFPVKEIVDIAKGIIGHSRFPAEGLENAVKGVVAKRLGGGETSALASQGIAV